MAISLAACSFIGASTPESAAKRDAQNLFSVFSSSLAAGHDFSIGTDGSVAQIVDAIVAGHTIDAEGSPFNGVYFGVPSLTDNEKRNAARFLVIDSTGFQYFSAGHPEPKPAVRWSIVVAWAAGLSIFCLAAIIFLLRSVSRHQHLNL